MKTKLFILLAAVCVAFPAFADGWGERHGYIGGNIGRIQLQDWCAGVADCKDSELAFRAFGGYAFNEYIAAEVGVTYAEGFSASIDDFSAMDLHYLAGDVGMHGRVPVNDIFAVSARAGVAFQKLTGTDVEKCSGKGIAEAISRCVATGYGADIMFGVGFEFAPRDSISMQMEWSRVSSDIDVDFFSVSAAYHF